MVAKSRLIHGIFLGLVLLCGTPAIAANTTLLDLPDGKKLQLDVPQGWQVDKVSENPAITLRLAQPGGKDFVVLLTVLPPSRNDKLTTPDSVRQFVMKEGNQALATAIQKELELSEIAGDGGTAYLYHLTDRNPEKKPGDYREVHQGGMLLAKHIVTITILTHTGDDSIVDQAKNVIRSMKIFP